MSGLWDPRAPGRKVDRSFMGRLMFGPYLLGVSERRVGPAFLGRLVAGPFPFEALWSGRLAMGVGLGPKVPTNLVGCSTKVPYEVRMEKLILKLRDWYL